MRVKRVRGVGGRQHAIEGHIQREGKEGNDRKGRIHTGRERETDRQTDRQTDNDRGGQVELERKEGRTTER